jgi:predicted transcriptional regulator
MRDFYDRLKTVQGPTVDGSLTIPIVGVSLTDRSKTNTERSTRRIGMTTSLVELAAEIAAAQASHAEMSPDEVGHFLRKAFETLRGLRAVEEGQVVAAPEEQPPALDPKQSVQRNKVICLECGKEFKQLTEKHLGTHGLTGKEYRKKYGFKASQPLAAKTLSAARRKRAIELGLGDKLKKARTKVKVKETAKPKRQRKATAGSKETPTKA